MPIMPVPDPFELSRFVSAQRDVIDRVRIELHAGFKSSHWIWFIFPQIAGLGSSQTARRYALSGLEEARAFIRHPVLGARLLECTTLLLALDDRSAEEILGTIDALKLQSAMTLCLRAVPEETRFRKLLEKYFDGHLDPATLQRI